MRKVPDNAWKRWERTVAVVLGGTRTGPRGLGLPDVLGTGIAPECKAYAGATKLFFTAKLRETIAQARANQQRVGEPHWSVFIKDTSVRGAEGEYVVLPMAYFKYMQDRLNKENTHG